jgi:(1->4)-alpha-D-glucan 1-alpha-D-glucosylmutase
MTPRATVRLQLTHEFGFDAARSHVGYYAALGISHFYLSPIFRAREGSTHGYDTVDFAHVSDELGGIEGLKRLVAALRKHGMGVILDIVPNHMGVAGKNNSWWNDVLVRGRDSEYARYFDIDWTPEHRALHGKVLLPYLDRPYADALNEGAIKVVCENGEWKIAHHTSRWPVAVDDALNAGVNIGRENLNALLERQHYRLDEWRVAPERINWRRFFDITELAALRIEDERVFADVHAATFALFEAELIDGVRIDHVDGLAYPIEYCHKLRDELDQRKLKRPELRDGEPYIVVEKIFASHEPQRDWGVAGTTGYDFMEQVGALMHNPAGQGVLDVLWRRVSGRPWEFRRAVSDARRQVLGESFGADLGRVASSFHVLASHASDTSHLTYAALRRALIELIVAFPVYRCYGMPGALAPEDAAILAFALERTMRELNSEDFDALDFIARCLRDSPEHDVEPMQREAAVRFQQLTAPIAAKAIEDTVFYREIRLLSRNEVGSDPNAFSMAVDEFHAACIARSRRFPHSMLTTATHDHKRGEDARMRLAALSDDAQRWSDAVSRWITMNAAHKTVVGGAAAPDAVDEFMLYQTLVSAWPLLPMDDAAETRFRERIAQWWTKALRESKRHSSWIAPNAAYESSCLKFLSIILHRQRNTFVAELADFVASIAAAAALSGLAQTFLRLTTPGIPDLYQGCEVWDFSLVDPDNRRPVDYSQRSRLLEQETSLVDSITHWRSGAVKQRLIATILKHRAAWPQLYASGDYAPISVTGARAAHIVAFERRVAGARLVCVASRWPLSIAGRPLTAPLIDRERWENTALSIESGRFADVLNDGLPVTLQSTASVAELLSRFPAALLFARGGSD